VPAKAWASAVRAAISPSLKEGGIKPKVFVAILNGNHGAIEAEMTAFHVVV
jgi:hypothetical protein